MKIYLSGGGSEKDSIELDKRFASTFDKSKPLLYIPIAINESTHPYPGCLKWVSNIFNPLGINKIEMWTEKELLEKKQLDKYGGVFIGGGNTFYLLKELRESGFLSKLEKIIEKDIPVYGGSAGAIILGKSIIPAGFCDLNEVKLKDLNGLNLIKGYDLWCHYKAKDNKDIQDYIKKHNLELIALPENSGLIVTEKSIEVVGPGSAFLPHQKMKEIKPGKYI